MSKDIIHSATIKANDAEVNFINFKSDELGNSIQPQLVKRTSLHPAFDANGDVEHRVYYTLHNDSADCVYVSPHLVAEEYCEISKHFFSPSDNNLTIKPSVPRKPPIPCVVVIHDTDDEKNWPGGGGGGSWSTDHDEDPDGFPTQVINKNFDDYAATLVAGGKMGFVEPSITIKTTSDIKRWFENISQMETARRAMKFTRDPNSSTGTSISASHPYLTQAEEMYFGSAIERIKLRCVKLVNGDRMFKNCSELEEATITDSALLKSAEEMCAGCEDLKEFSMRESVALTNAKRTL